MARSRSKVRRALVHVLGAGLASLCTPALAHASASPAALQRAADRLVADGVPGVIAIERQGSREWRVASGVADLRTGAPIRVNDRYRIGSITKSFVSAVVLQLVGEGRLSLRDTVAKWVPGLVPHGDSITVDELLHHTSGIPDYADARFVLNVYHDPLRPWTPRQLVAYAVDHPPLFPPGTQWSYSNTNYVLLGLIIDAVDRVPPTLEEEGPAREVYGREIVPLHLEHTSFPLHDPGLPSPFAHGDLIDAPKEWDLPGLLDTTRMDPSSAWTAGGIVGTIDDVARFHRALFGGRLLRPAQQEELEATVQIAPGLAYGAGVEKLQTPCGVAWGHDGSTPSSVDLSLTSPDGARQLVIALTRDARTWSAQTFTDVTHAYLTGYCGRRVSRTAARSLARHVTRRLLALHG